MSELKSCPNCGPNGAPLRRIGEMDEYRVECIKCYTVRTPWFKTPGEAEAYWNAFAEGMEQQAARIAELEKEKSELLAKCEKYEYEIGLAKQQIAALESKSNMYIDLAVAMASTARKVDGLEKERDRLREALLVIASGHFSGTVELVNTKEMKTVWKSDVGLPMTVSEARDIARKAVIYVGNETP